jgi:hypothetical protein
MAFTLRRQVSVHPMWVKLTDWLCLDRDLSRVWWEAIAHSKRSAAIILRQNFELSPALRLNIMATVYEVCHPAKLVAVVEDLVEETLLSRAQATVIEERIFYETKPAPPTVPETMERALFGRVMPAQTWHGARPTVTLSSKLTNESILTDTP